MTFISYREIRDDPQNILEAESADLRKFIFKKPENLIFYSESL
jgi:hypothetical protein